MRERTVASPSGSGAVGRTCFLSHPTLLLSGVLVHRVPVMPALAGHLGQACCPGGPGCTAYVVMSSLEKSLRLGKEIWIFISGQATPNIPAFWKGWLFFCFGGSGREMCVRASGRRSPGAGRGGLGAALGTRASAPCRFHPVDSLFSSAGPTQGTGPKVCRRE